jgi:indole-3-glycerol phosphate synthase
VLGSAADDWLARTLSYGRAGAAAVSVLTEPSRFDGSLEHLREAAAVLAPLGVPAMRKDFLVDPYQVVEARVHGAGGVLVILRMLSRAQITELLDAAAAQRLFVLLEAFDAADLELAAEFARARAGREESLLIGVNCRDLQTLEVVPQRFAALSALLPNGLPPVAESGVGNAAEAAAMRRLGFRVALIGTALMTHADPAALLAEIFAATRTVTS